MYGYVSMLPLSPTMCLFAFFLFHNVRQKVEPEFWIAKFGFGNKLVDLLIC